MQAPLGTVPGVVPLELVLAQTGRAAVFITHLAGYPEGFQFELVAIAAAGDDQETVLDPMLFGLHRRRLRPGDGDIPEDMLRIGVQFSDGRKATNTSGFPERRPDYENPPEGPVMHSGDGGGHEHRWHQSLWVWPLPPPGPLALVCQWPAAGIPLTRHELDAQLILDAAARAQVVFPDSPHPGGTISTSIHSIETPQARPTRSPD